MEVGLSPGHIVLHRNPALPPKGHSHPFSADVCCGQMAGWIKMPHGMEVGLSPGHTVLDEHPAPRPQRGTACQFSAHVYCGQTAGWIKMPLGMELGLGSGHIVRCGPSSPQMGTAPQFRPMSAVTKRLHGSRYHLVRM